MNKLFKKLTRFERVHGHDVMVLCGAIALAISLCVFAGSGIPRALYAWYIYVWPVTYTPVEVGGNTTISWQAPTADNCSITGPGLPCYTYGRAPFAFTYCGASTYGQYGSVQAGPLTGPSTYTIYCQNVDAGGGGGSGSNSITVVPTPKNTTLSSFVANPTSVSGGGQSTLSWSGTKGTKFSSCQLTGGQWGTSGAWFTALPGNVTATGIVADTSYTFNCFDADGANTGARTATVTVTDACGNIPGFQSSAPANGTSSGGTCSCNSGFVLQGNQCVGADSCNNIAGTQTGAPSNGHTNTDGSCSCNSGYALQGGSCVAACTGAHQVGTPPSCSCDTGYQMQGGVCVAVACPGQNEVNWPSCTCATGFSRDGATNLCIHSPQLNIKVNNLDSVRVRKGASVSLTWSATGITAASCAVRSNTGALVGSGDSGSVSRTIDAQTTYRLTCINEAGSSVSKEASITLIPSVTEQ